MLILVACEESGIVCEAFRKKGHGAFSCDLLETSGNHPGWHLQGDVRNLLGNRRAYPWDMIIAFPPCTDLAISGARWFPEKRASGQQARSIEFFMRFATYDLCDKVAIENPIGIMSTRYRSPDQIIQPWQYGHTAFKATCLWLKGLPLLMATDVVLPPCPYGKMTQEEKRIWGEVHQATPGPDRERMRSRTYTGIATAMAEQWGR